ncbi:metallophosphoesterase family protein, partial [Nostoc sp. NIES-2111]
MTKVALIADVHGNFPALDAIIASVGEVDLWICAGDIAGHLPFVDEVAARLQELGAFCVKGNHDRALVECLAIPGSSAATRVLQLQRRYVSPSTQEWLSRLPERLDLDIDGRRITVVHGGPRSYLDQKILSVTGEVREFARGGILVLGHTHRQLVAADGDAFVINPGP